MDKQPECQSCKSLHRKIRVYHPPKKNKINLTYVEKVLGKVSENWFDELSQTRIKEDEKKEIKGYGKVKIQTELSSLTPSTRDSNKTLYASTPGQGELTPLSAWARINSEDSEISSPITFLNTDAHISKCTNKDKAIPSHVTDLINEELDMTWTSSMATPKLNPDVHLSQDSTITEQFPAINKIKGLPRVLFSPGPGGLSVSDELGFSLNTTVDDNTIINAKESSMCELPDSSQNDSVFHPALLELGCNAFNPSPAKPSMSPSSLKEDGKVDNSEMPDESLQELKCESPDNDNTVLSALSDFFDTPNTFEKRKKPSRSRKRKSSCLGISDSTPENSSVSQTNLTPSSILKNKKQKTSSKCKRVTFGETFYSSDPANVQDSTVIKDQLNDLIDLVVMKESSANLTSSVESLTASRRAPATVKRSSSTSSPPGHADYLFSQISPSSLKTMCELAEDKKSKVDKNKVQSENKVQNKNKVQNENQVPKENKELKENNVLINEVPKKTVINQTHVLDENKVHITNKILNKTKVPKENKVLNQNLMLNDSKVLNKNEDHLRNKVPSIVDQNNALPAIDELKGDKTLPILDTCLLSNTDNQNQFPSKDISSLKNQTIANTSMEDLNMSITSSEAGSQSSSRSSQENKLSLKPKARRFLYPSLNQITKSSPKTVYGFKKSTQIVKSSPLCTTSSASVKSETLNEVKNSNTSDIKAAIKLGNQQETLETKRPIGTDQALDVSPEDKASVLLSQRTKNAVDDIVNNLDSQFFDEDMDTTPKKSSQNTQEEADWSTESTIQKTSSSGPPTTVSKPEFIEERKSEATNVNVLTSYEQLPGFSTAGGKNLQPNMEEMSKAEQLFFSENLENMSHPIQKDNGQRSVNSSFIQIDGQVSFKRKSLKADNSVSQVNSQYNASAVKVADSSCTKSKKVVDDDLESILSDMMMIKKKNQDLKQMGSQEKSISQYTSSTSKAGVTNLPSMSSSSIPISEDYKSPVTTAKDQTDMESVLSNILSAKARNRNVKVNEHLKLGTEGSGGFSTASGSKIKVNLTQTANSIMTDFTNELSQDFEFNSESFIHSKSLPKTPAVNVKVDFPKVTSKRHNGFNPFKTPRLIKKLPDAVKPVRTKANSSHSLPKTADNTDTIVASNPKNTFLEDEFASDTLKRTPDSVAYAKTGRPISLDATEESDNEDCFDTQMSEIMMKELDDVSSKLDKDAVDEPTRLDECQISRQAFQNKFKEHLVIPIETTKMNSQESNLEQNVKVFFKMSKLSKQMRDRNSQNSQELETNTPPFITCSAIKPHKQTPKIFLSEEAVNKDQLKSQFPKVELASGRKAVMKESSMKSAQDLFKEESCPNKNLGDSRPKFPMFKTALGKDVTVKEESMKTAKNLLDDGQDVTRNELLESSLHQLPSFQTSSAESLSLKEDSTKTANDSFVTPILISNGFQTASGQKVHVSDRALHHVQAFLKDEVSAVEHETIQETLSLNSKFPMFATASGKKVQIKEDSLQHIKEALDFDKENCMQSESLIEDEQTVPNIEHSNSKRYPVQKYSLHNDTAVPDIQEKSADSRLLSVHSAVTSQTRDTFIGFQTASGHKAKANPISIVHAKKLFEDNISELVEIPANQSVEIASTSSELAGIPMGCSFQTASGKGVNVSAKSLKYVQDIFREESICDSQQLDGAQEKVKPPSSNFRMLSNNANEKELHKTQPMDSFPKTNTSKMSSNLFQTASGKGITVDNASLKQVQDIFQDDPSSKTTTNLFQTASGKGITVDNASMKHVQDIFKDDPSLKTSTNLFQTASGKGITVDNASLKHVQDIFMDDTSPQDEAEKHTTVTKAQNVPLNVSNNNNAATSIIGCSDPKQKYAPKKDSQILSKPIKPCFVTPDKRKSVHPQSTPRSSKNTVLNERPGFSEDRVHKNYKPVYSYPEQHYLDRGSRHHPLLSTSIDTRKATYEDQLDSLLGQHKSSEKSKFQTPYRKTESTPNNKTDDNSEPVIKSAPFLAKRSLKLGGTPVKPESHEKEASPGKLPCSSEKKDVHVDPEILDCHLVEARMKQEKIIRYKKKKKTRPLAGQLSTMKRERTSSIKYEDLNREHLTRQELLGLGCLESTLAVKSSTAVEHRFQLLDFYPGSLNKDILVGDGAILIPDNYGFAGKEEFYKSFQTMEGVDVSLISVEWFENHFRWVVWKLAAYEVAFPHDFIRRSLTPNNVMLQLKYRYDKEIDQCYRSCIKKIVERDDTASKRLVLCISDIKQLDQVTVVEVTDGWYSIRASLDTPLLDLVHKKRLVIGQKLVTTGADLVGSQDACSPLEIPESLQLKLCFNSTRPVSWHSRLDYQHDPRPLIVPITSLHSNGGMIGTIDIVVVRIYPVLYMEKLPDGGCIFRSAELEETLSRKHEQRKQVMIEKLYTKLQSDMEKSHHCKDKKRRSNQRWKKEDIEQLTTGQEILEAVECSLQPEDIQSLLSERQVELMREYQQKQHDDKQQQLQSEIQQTLADNQQMNVERNVTPLLKMRVSGCCQTDIDNQAATILTIWRPSSEWFQLQEGKRYKLYNVQASSSRGQLESLCVSLTSCRNTRIKYLPIDENLLDVIYEPREVWSVADLKVRKPTYKEFDFVGMVFDVENGRQGNMQIVHCIDIDGGFLNITFWTGLKNFGCEDILVIGKCFVACNLILKSSYSQTIVSDVLQEVTQISNSSKVPQYRKYLDRFHSIKQVKRNELIEEARNRYKDRHNTRLSKTPQKQYNNVPLDVEELLSPMTLDIGDSSLNSSTSNNVSPEEQAEKKRKSIQKAKTAKLLAYGSPGALLPINCAISPAVAQGFKTPILRKKPK